MGKRVKKLFTDIALFAMSSFTSKFLAFLLLPLYTSVLPLEAYSTADIINNAVALLIPILTLSIYDATLRFSLDKDVDSKKVLSNSMCLTFIAAGIMLAATPFVKIFAEKFLPYWWYLLATFFVVALQQCLYNYIKGINKTHIFAIQGILHTVVLILCNLLFLLKFKLGLDGYLLSAIIASIASIVYMCISVNAWKDLFLIIVDRPLLKKMLSYSIPMLFTTIAWWANTSLDKYMLIGFVGLSANALYAVAHKIPTIFTTVTTLFSQAWRLSVISAFEEDDEQSTAKFCSSVHNKYALLCIYACAGITLLSQPLSKFLFRAEYYAAWTLVPPLMLASLFEAFSGFAASVYAAVKKTNFLFISTGMGVVFNVVLNYFLIQRIGMIGAPIATFLCFALVWAVRMIVLKRFIGININLPTLIPSMVVLVFGCMYYAFDLQYKICMQLVCMCVIFLINAKTNKEVFAFIADAFMKLKKQ